MSATWAIQYQSSTGMKHWMYFAQNWGVDEQSARYWVLANCDARVILKSVEVENYNDLIARYANEK